MESLSFAITHFTLRVNKSSPWEINQQIFMLKPEISGVICIQDIISEKIHSVIFSHGRNNCKELEIQQVQMFKKDKLHC